LITENQTAIKILKIKKIVAHRFLFMKSFFTYSLGPASKAIPAINAIIANVKHIANLAGKNAISGAITTHMRIKKAATQNAMMPPMKLFSPGRKLKIDSQPCGSGSVLPSTKFFAC
jgi:hypothetical protein